ncbi:MAG: uncharacterized protein KVP18_004954 [Porospora cf. gigantea A]|nr:MAG: hypothetical protein KVP18_004954 [Porospora cf. gigantea A]
MNLKNGDATATPALETVVPTEKPKKKRNKKKGGKVWNINDNVEGLDNSRFRLVGSWAERTHSRQTMPPTCPVAEVYTNKKYPVGDIQHYDDRHTNEVNQAKDAALFEDWNNVRKAAEVHRETRKYLQSFVQPGMSYVEICSRLEAKYLELVQAEGLKAGRGFPTGVSANHCAAHYTPNTGDETVLGHDDIVKVDFGVHVEGRIVDCAFTMAFNDKFDPLIECTKQATKAGIAAAGIDVRFSDVGAAIEEVLSAYEMEIDGKMVPIKPIRNLNSHSIAPYHIHGGKTLPIVKTNDQNRMEENEIFAIETFASTGKGWVEERGECSHFMRTDSPNYGAVQLKGARELLKSIDTHFGTLPFCRRWLDELGNDKHFRALKHLQDKGIVMAYPPLCDLRGSFTSQNEHTILLRPTCKEVVSRGDDF